MFGIFDNLKSKKKKSSKSKAMTKVNVKDYTSGESEEERKVVFSNLGPLERKLWVE